MSGSTHRYTRAIGAAAVGTLLLALSPVAGAHAAPAAKTPRFAAAVKTSAVSQIAASGTAVASKATAGTAPAGCKINALSPLGANVGASQYQQHFTLTTLGSDCPDNLSWTAYYGTETSGDDYFVSQDQSYLTWEPKLLKNSDVGLLPLNVVLTDTDTSETVDTKAVNYNLRRNATWGKSIDATPEPVKKGRTITVHGTLLRVNWLDNGKTPGYVAYSKQTVQVQFLASGASAWTTIKTVQNAAGGKVAATVKAVKTGTWRLHFGGTSTTGPSNSGGDSVKVN